MKKNIILIISMISIFIKISYAVPVIELKDYNDYDFSGKKVVLIQKGDNPEYKTGAYNDSGRDTISLPSCWNQFLFYFIQPSWIIPLVFCFYVTIKKLKKDTEAKYLLGSFIIIGVLFINDVLIERRVCDFMSLSNYGFVVVIFGTAIIMRNRFARLYEKVEIFRARKSRKPVITDDTKNNLNWLYLSSKRTTCMISQGKTSRNRSE
jgi:hypothetical protein